MKTLTEKEQIVKRLLESKAITFEESLLLLEKEQQLFPVTIPSNPIYPQQPLTPFWWQSPNTVYTVGTC